MSVLESIFVKRNNLANSESDSVFYTASAGKKKKSRKHGKAIQAKNVRNSPIDPNCHNYHSQLLKEQLREKFSGYEYGLSDW